LSTHCQACSTAVRAEAHRMTTSTGLPFSASRRSTTFSAAEVVGGGAFTAALNREKRIFGHPKLTPTLVVLDGEIAATTPRPILLESGMNAIHHCIESLYSKGSQRITDAFALHALRGLLYSLPQLGPDAIEPDIQDFQIALESASISGLTYGNSWLGIGHAICHSLGGRFGLSHGGSNSVIVRHSLRFNMESAAHKLDFAAGAIGICSNVGRPSLELARRIDALAIRLGVPQTLRDLGLQEMNFDAIADDVMNDPQIIWNPRSVSRNDIISLLEQAW